MRIALLANSRKPDAVAAGHDLMALLANRATPILVTEPDLTTLRNAKPDLVIVLGGDGSILHVAPQVAELGAPVVGINFGKLGYLAAFSLSQFKHHLEAILDGQAVVSKRLMLEGAVYHNARIGAAYRPLATLQLLAPGSRHHALNDIVINAGEPFRMIELHVQIDDQDTTTFRGDGVIVSTASGSTGYNLSSGGPLISPEVPAMVLTPICAHSLSFRPVVIADSSTITLHAHRANPGTKISFDGQRVQTLSEDDCVVIRRAPVPLKLVENPSLSHWQMLASKLQWAQSPRQ